MTAGCARWIAIADRDSIGDAVSREEHEFARQHEQTCTLCARESAAWQRLSREPWQMVPSPADARAAEAFLAKLRGSAPASGSVFRHWKRASVAGAAAVTVVAAAAGWMLVQGHRAPKPAPLAVATARVVVAGRGADSGGSVVKAGMELSEGGMVDSGEGPLCLAVDRGVMACLGPHTRVQWLSARADHRKLQLLHGVVGATLDPQPAGTDFGISTSEGSATAIGTEFTVDATGANGVDVRVSHGLVLVQDTHGGQTRLGAAQMISLRDLLPRPVDELAARGDQTRLGPARLSRVGGGQSAIMLGTSAPANVRIDGVELGPTPVSAWVAPGDHALRLSVEGHPPVEESLHLLPGDQVLKTFEVGAVAPPQAPSPELSPDGESDNVRPPEYPPARHATSLHLRPERPAQILQRTRELRSQGRFELAAKEYRRLLASYPRSPEAHAASVSLGDLQLSRLRDPEGALRSFDRYLASGGGALSQEAAHGRIVALRTLGRVDEERQAIDDFVTRYPSSVQTPLLAARRKLLHAPL